MTVRGSVDTDPMVLADALVEKWHLAFDEDVPLWVYMGLTKLEYGTFIERGVLPADFVARHSEIV